MHFFDTEFSSRLAGLLFLPVGAYANDQNVNNDVSEDHLWDKSLETLLIEFFNSESLLSHFHGIQL